MTISRKILLHVPFDIIKESINYQHDQLSDLIFSICLIIEISVYFLFVCLLYYLFFLIIDEISLNMHSLKSNVTCNL